jgi:hypothetical protein
MSVRYLLKLASYRQWWSASGSGQQSYLYRLGFWVPRLCLTDVDIVLGLQMFSFVFVDSRDINSELKSLTVSDLSYW